jgi:predicted acyltransferase
MAVQNGHWWAYRSLFASWGGVNEFTSFLFALFFALVCWWVVYLFNQKGVFLKV